MCEPPDWYNDSVSTLQKIANFSRSVAEMKKQHLCFFFKTEREKLCLHSNSYSLPATVKQMSALLLCGGAELCIVFKKKTHTHTDIYVYIKPKLSENRKCWHERFLVKMHIYTLVSTKESILLSREAIVVATEPKWGQ